MTTGIFGDSLSTILEDQENLYYAELPSRKEVASQILHIEGKYDLSEVMLMAEQNTLEVLNNRLESVKARKTAIIEAILHGLVDVLEVPEVFNHLEVLSLRELYKLNDGIEDLIEDEQGDACDVLVEGFDYLATRERVNRGKAA